MTLFCRKDLYVLVWFLKIKVPLITTAAIKPATIVEDSPPSLNHIKDSAAISSAAAIRK